MVTTEHYLSALIGVQVLKQGGNATDAAVAAIFAEGVLNPHMHTLGGESPMLIYQADTGRVSAINGNTAAAQRATPAMELARDGFPMHPGLRGPSDYLAFSLYHQLEKFQDRWPTSAQLYLPQGQLPNVGDVFRNPDLAHTFERLLQAERDAAGDRRAGLGPLQN